jgi:23S rRNA (uracil1939-C5)-methyltransferase
MFSLYGKIGFCVGKSGLFLPFKSSFIRYICKKNSVSRKKQKPFYEGLTIEDIGSEGKALARTGEMVVFTSYAVPGDVVDLQVTKRRKKYAEATITKFHKYSDDRIENFCSHFGVCGGCKWQILPYESQLHYKQKQVKDQLQRIGKMQMPELLPILKSEKTTFYRNKLEFTFSNKRWLTADEMNVDIKNMDALGFHVPGLFDKIVKIDKCWLQPEPSNKIRNFIYNYAIENGLSFFDIKAKSGFLRTLIIRTSSIGETMIILSFYHEDEVVREGLLNAVKNEFPEITSLLYVINSKGNDTITDQQIELFSGREFIFEQMEDLKFKIGPKSFYQTNSEQAYNLYKIVRDFAELKGDEIVYDLYTGTGTIANFVANRAKKVVGIEYIPEAIDDAKENSAINNINNTSFYSGDIKSILNDEFILKNGRPDIIITDPPRAGMHNDVIETMIKSGAEKIIYVSCNPATQARDLALLDVNYEIKEIQPVDMFPHTHHVENVVLLGKRTLV